MLDLTAAGARLRAVVLEKMAKPPESLNRLSPEEQRALVKIMKHLAE